MECLPKNCFVKFNDNQLQAVRKLYNLDKPGDMSRAIDVLEDWVKMQKHFMKKDLPRNYLEKVIIAAKGSLERGKTRLDKMCTLRTIIPNFFGENLTSTKYNDTDCLYNILLPKPTEENYRVFVLKAIGSTFTFEFMTKYYMFIILLCEYFMAYDYSDGVRVIIDYTEANVFEIVKVLNLTELRHLINVVTQGFGLRLKGIHFLTTSKAIETVLSILKQLLSSKLAARVYVHKDMNALYEIIPKDILPVEYGGKEKSRSKLNDELIDELTSEHFMNYIKEMNKAKIDETCRQADKLGYSDLGIPGSFRTLNVD